MSDEPLPADTDEEWRPVPSHPHYAVSTLGRVMRTERGQGSRPDPLIRGTMNPQGHRVVQLRGPHREVSVHLLVWAAFRGPVPEGHVVGFADGDRANPALANLLAETRREAMARRRREGRERRMTLGDADIAAIAADRDRTARELAAAYGVHLSTITHIRQGIYTRQRET